MSEDKFVLECTVNIWGGAGVVMAPLMKSKEENTYQPPSSRLITTWLCSGASLEPVEYIFVDNHN
jgi:hypothetical protein